jgi:hypothetical protein
MTLSDALRLIAAADSVEFASLDNAMQKRRLQLREQRVSSARKEICLGDTVQVTAGIKPKYMAGRTGEVVSRMESGKGVRVDFGENVGRYGRIVGVPYSCLLKLDEVDV